MGIRIPRIFFGGGLICLIDLSLFYKKMRCCYVLVMLCLDVIRLRLFTSCCLQYPFDGLLPSSIISSNLHKRDCWAGPKRSQPEQTPNCSHCSLHVWMFVVQRKTTQRECWILMGLDGEGDFFLRQRKLTKRVTRYDKFFSHDWGTSQWLKFLSLLILGRVFQQQIVLQFSTLATELGWSITDAELVHDLEIDMGVSKNNGTPKSSILIGFSSIINHPFWGTPTFGNIHMFNLEFKRIRTLWFYVLNFQDTLQLPSCSSCYFHWKPHMWHFDLDGHCASEPMDSQFGLRSFLFVSRLLAAH